MKASVTYIPVAAGPQPPAVPPPASGAQRITDPTLDRITQLTEAPGTSTARAFEYDAQHRLTEIKLNGVREHGYDLNDRNQRIREYSHDTKSYMQYTYDNQGQLTFYGRRETGEFEGGSPSIYFGGYTYDMVGNRLVKMWMGGDDVIYTPNVVNQYSKITEMENSWEPGIETEFAYNPDGCQLSSTGGWSYAWNGENRLISAENGDTRLEFNYDYMGRRFEKKVYSANVLTKHEKFVYDGYKLIQVLDALNDNAVTMTFVWHPESTGLDTPFSMTYDGEIYYYVTDGNKNVMSLIDAAGTKVAEYVYDPFGRLLSSTGELAEINPFRFSSEYHDDETGLVYYNYRYYSPELGRWISRDPIEEEGGVNLYAMVGNNPITHFDQFGLFSFVSAPSWELTNAIQEVMESTHAKIKKSFMCWYNKEKLDKSWVYKLKRCPKELKKVYVDAPIRESLEYQLYMLDPNRKPMMWPATYKKVVGYGNPDENEWAFEEASDYEAGFFYVGWIFHPGAKYELRTSEPLKYGNNGNQCTYDCYGKMINSIPAAGTADRSAPRASNNQHFSVDVLPFIWAKYLGKSYVYKYYDVRPIW